MLKGILTNLLSQEARNKGYELSEDEDFIYLHLAGKTIATFTYHTTLQEIEHFIIEGE